MKAHLAYFKYVTRHIYFVVKACFKLRVPFWQAITHDWTKFLPIEWIAYVHQFYNPDGTKKEGIRDKTGAYDPSQQPIAFQKAWLHHQRLKHHWQAWVSIGDYGKLCPLEIPECYLREMIADWIGAGQAQSGKATPCQWYGANKEKMVLHPMSRMKLESILEKIK